MGLLLNLGAGDAPVPAAILGERREIRVDIDGAADVCADVRRLPFADGCADVVYNSHLVEHFAEWEVVPMLAEWRRVLKPGGTLQIRCPDIQSAAELIAVNGIDAALYKAHNGVMIRGQDVLFGWQPWVQEHGEPMRHKVAFDARKLAYSLHAAGFTDGEVARDQSMYELRATAIK